MKTFPEILASHHCFMNGQSHIGRIHENVISLDLALTEHLLMGLILGSVTVESKEGGVVYRDSLKKNNESD